MTDFDGDNHAHEPSAAELAEMDRGEQMASLVERLLHPNYVEPSKAMGGYILDPVTVRRDLTAAAEELVRLNTPTHKDGHPIIKKVDDPLIPKDVSVSIGVTHPGDKHLDRGAVPNTSDGAINFVVLASCADNSSHKNNGEAPTWEKCMEVICDQLQEWIDEDGYNVRVIAISATRDPVQHRRTSPV